MDSRKLKPYIVGVDPSGSYNEGKGTTGICVLNPEGKLVQHFPVFAQDFASQLSYWKAVIDSIEMMLIKYPDAVLSIEDYVLYQASASAQINSEMETSKLIGALTMFAYEHGTHIFIRNAAQVKKRWTNEILMHEQIITKTGRIFTDMQGNPINHHCLDAVRHAVHCYHFEVDKEKYLR